MVKNSAERARGYYERHKKTVLFRKAIKRCRERGFIPTLESMRKNEIPVTALLVAFAEWAGRNGSNSKIKMQYRKIAQIRGVL